MYQTGASMRRDDGNEGTEADGRLPRPVVLVVEDEAPLLRAIGRVLRPNFEVLAARDPAEARALAGVRRLDLILTDYSMPGENGLEGLRRLRELGHRAPALIVTADADAAVGAAVDVGLASAVIEKPWAANELLAAALRLVGRPLPTKHRAC